MATFVLCHGAHGGGWQWRTTADLLRSQGHVVFTPTLTGLGERVHLLQPDISLETHITDIVNVFVYEQLDQVILVGHSYGGVVITGVADQIPERIAQLVYLYALVPHDGQSIATMLAPEVLAQLVAVVDQIGEGWKLPHIPEAGKPADARFGFHPLKTGMQPVTLRNPAALALPRTFIYCTQDKELMVMGSLIIQAADHARRDPAWRYYELPTDHVPMDTMPQSLAALFDEIADGRKLVHG